MRVLRTVRWPEDLDVLLSVVLAAAIPLGVLSVQASAGLIVFWLTQCACGVLVHWRPRLAVGLLGTSVSVLAFSPHAWSGLGSYATLIVVISLVMRGHWAIAGWATAWFVVALTLESFHALDYQPLGWVYFGMWCVLIGMAWLVGGGLNSVLASRRLRGQVVAMAARQQLARELHDTVTHSLSLINLRAAEARAGCLSPEKALVDVEAFSRHASGELRQLLSTLRGEPGDRVEPGTETVASIVDHARVELDRGGFTLHSSGDDSAPLPAATAQVLRSLLVSGAKNIVRHGDPAVECEVAHSLEGGRIEATLINRIRTAGPDSPRGGSGLRAAQAELEAADGWLHASRQGQDWVLQAGLPLVLEDRAR